MGASCADDMGRLAGPAVWGAAVRRFRGGRRAPRAGELGLRRASYREVRAAVKTRGRGSPRRHWISLRGNPTLKVSKKPLDKPIYTVYILRRKYTPCIYFGDQPMPRPPRPAADAAPMSEPDQASRPGAGWYSTARRGCSLRGIVPRAWTSPLSPCDLQLLPAPRDLITALIVDAFNALADAIHAAEACRGHPSPMDRGLLASCLAYREWATRASGGLPASSMAIRSRLRCACRDHDTAGGAGPSMGCSASSSRPTRPANW